MTYYVLFIGILAFLLLIILYALWKGIKILGLSAAIFGAFYISSLFWNPLVFPSGSNTTINYSYSNVSYIQEADNFDNLGILQSTTNTTITSFMLSNQSSETLTEYTQLGALENFLLVVTLFIVYFGFVIYFSLDLKNQREMELEEQK